MAVAVLGRRLAPGGGGRVGARALRAAAALGLSLAWPAGRWRGRRRRRPGPPTPAVTALDIGQGDAILLRSPEGAAAVVDTGPPGPPAPVVAALRRLGCGGSTSWC